MKFNLILEKYITIILHRRELNRKGFLFNSCVVEVLYYLYRMKDLYNNKIIMNKELDHKIKILYIKILEKL